MPVQPMPLARIATHAGFSMADVAFLANLDESTVCRLWDEPYWLDRIKGRSLQAIIGTVPGVADYVARYTLARRRSQLDEELSGTGLQLEMESFKHLVVNERIPEQYLSNALDTAVHIMRGSPQRSAAYLARFWGQEQDLALGFLFKPVDQFGLLADARPLLEAATSVVEKIARQTNSFHAMVAQATLIHHIAQATGTSLIEPSPSKIERPAAIAYRSGMIGLILQSNDRSIAAAYGETVRRSRLMTLVEEWAFPTYTHDAKLTSDFSLPRSLLARNTTQELLREIDNYNDAYLYYLADTGLPAIARNDPTFGLRVTELKEHLRRRLETCADQATVRMCESTARSLADEPAYRKEDPFAQRW